MDPNNSSAKQSVHTNTETLFNNLASLPTPLSDGQCVFHKNEILICGGYRNNECYSYHTVTNRYKRICSYPSEVTLLGHTVVKRVNTSNANDITLLSIGGQAEYKPKHTLMMRYVSVWDDKASAIEKDKGKPYNQWVPFTNNEDKVILIGRKQDDYRGARAIIGGSNNNLLFITYRPNNIDLFDLNTFKYVSNSTLPIGNCIWYHCFVSTHKANETEDIQSKKNEHEMLLFCDKMGLLINYHEDNNQFRFCKIRVCSTLRLFSFYTYFYINDFILFFGGHGGVDAVASNKAYRYSVAQNKWMQFEHNLPIGMYGSAGALDEGNAFVHIVGGRDDNDCILSTHIKTNVKKWMNECSAKEKQWIIEEGKKEDIEREIEDIKRVKGEIAAMRYEFNLKKLPVEFVCVYHYCCCYFFALAAVKFKTHTNTSFFHV
ncbi:hypothetical protein RFI_32661 [Reticulomyxa filosa]|uniref:Kelch motif family protein n=1 Tax=Reticulomyxa filosa TaxID=46433 RepID=X6LTN1_RETFI|nr:hypothetical protein RFI_32661 [Reticulomyxa filosa]|eukprot:ETO04736.1 hypothetical protein RFI_32661 [Reticulomyxa filosa]